MDDNDKVSTMQLPGALKRKTKRKKLLEQKNDMFSKDGYSMCTQTLGFWPVFSYWVDQLYQSPSSIGSRVTCNLGIHG